MLIDTDVLVWYMRGNEKARRLIRNTNDFSISVVTYIELVQGLRNKEELSVLRNSARQENLWVNSGSGSSPIVRNSAILRTS